MLRLPILALTACAAISLLQPVGAAAQDVMGSGIAPGEAANSGERPIAFAQRAPARAAVVVVATSAELPGGIPGLPADAAARLAAAEFTGAAGQSVDLPGAPGAPLIRVFGSAEENGATDWREIGARIAQAIGEEDEDIAVFGLADPATAAQAALGFSLGQYRFDRYKSDRTAPPAQTVTFVSPQARAFEAAYRGREAALAEGVKLARDMINEPANVIYPESFVERTRTAFAGVDNVDITVLGQAEMRRLGMGAIAGVGQGSRRGTRLMLITYRGADGPPIALVGKGITFDTGGISIKPNSGMWEMKGDMSGAAAVTGALLSLAKSKAPVHAVAVAALAENMPGDNAQRPGDVVRTLSGKTIEIRSTDAEGRLVLSDAIEYTVREKDPFALIDIATLTGSVVGALGPEYAGVFAREDAYAQAAISAGETVDEPLWRLPLHEAYRKAIESDIADIKNSDAAPAPGASAGAHFIEYFVPENLPWIHIDIAGVDRSGGSDPVTPAGARGFGVMLLDRMAREWRPQ